MKAIEKESPLHIALLDDKEFGKTQIRNALPVGISAEIIWFADMTSFRASKADFDLLFLDYYLDHDNITSDMVFAEVRKRATTIIAFSSSTAANRKLRSLGANYAIDKVWQERNDDLENLLLEIC